MTVDARRDEVFAEAIASVHWRSRSIISYRIVFLSYLDFGATHQLLTDLAEDLIRYFGCKVSVVGPGTRSGCTVWPWHTSEWKALTEHSCMGVPPLTVPSIVQKSLYCDQCTGDKPGEGT
jgi:hypothetical protein